MSLELLTRRAIHLARRGKMNHKTNPMVGAILSDQDDRIVSEGWHAAFGKLHAERDVYNRLALKEANIDIGQLRLIVTLEPCNIYGKTPPCTELIISSPPDKVIISDLDPNPHMQGKSLDILDQHNVAHSVYTHPESARLIRSFSVNQSESRPYVILKYAQSRDGYLAKPGEQTKISNTIIDRLVHKWRAEVDGILIGKNTLIMDNPRLTTRDYFGPSPMRFVLTHKRVANIEAYHIASDHNYAQIYESNLSNQNEVNVEDTKNLVTILQMLYASNIGTIMIEGGRHTLQQFIDQNLWDEARIITNESLDLLDGTKAPELNGKLMDSIKFRSNVLRLLVNESITCSLNKA